MPNLLDISEKLMPSPSKRSHRSPDRIEGRHDAHKGPEASSDLALDKQLQKESIPFAEKPNTCYDITLASRSSSSVRSTPSEKVSSPPLLRESTISQLEGRSEMRGESKAGLDLVLDRHC